MKKILIILILFITSASCFAFDKSVARGYISTISGLYGATCDSMGCFSDYKMLDNNRSNLGYYTEPSSVYLVLNYYNGSSKTNTHNALIQAAKTLSKNAIGYTLPQSIIANLQVSKIGSWKHGKYLIKVVRDNFPSGRGYEIHFEILEQ